MSALKFLYTYSVFMFTALFLIGLGAPTFLENLPSAPEPPEFPDVSGWTDIFDIIIWGFKNIVYFFELMLVSSSIRAVTLILITPFIICLIWIVLSFVRGVSS